jgi:hypothetical protein
MSIPNNITVIDIQVCGDHWLNSDPAQQQLDEINHVEDYLLLRINSEGPSLHALGVVDMVMAHCDRTGRDPESVLIQSWLNEVEQVPFRKIDTFWYSHFLWMSRRYWNHDIIDNIRENRLALFIGRRTLPRRVIMHHIWHHYRDTSLLSIMRNPVEMPKWGIDLDTHQQWFGHRDITEFAAWWSSPPIDSIDGMTVGAQYQDGYNTNLSILDHYHRFGIEIVCESYCRGDTFFMTEKTVRPMVGLKPMIVYGPRRYLERLRDMGFRTWQEFWDESYDQFEGPDRWEAIKVLLEKLHALSDTEFWNLVDGARDVVHHNLAMLRYIVEKNAPE